MRAALDDALTLLSLDDAVEWTNDGDVDATAQKASAEKFEVQGFPTLKWFVGGEAKEYTGGRTEAEIVSWVLNQTARVHSVRPTRERVANPGDLLKVLQADQRTGVRRASGGPPGGERSRTFAVVLRFRPLAMR